MPPLQPGAVVIRDLEGLDFQAAVLRLSEECTRSQTRCYDLIYLDDGNIEEGVESEELRPPHDGEIAADDLELIPEFVAQGLERLTHREEKDTVVVGSLRRQTEGSKIRGKVDTKMAVFG